MRTTVVVEHEKQCEHRLMILPFFTKRVRQPSQSADVHSDRQIVPFGVRCANSILIGIAVAYVLARLDYFARRVAMLICGGAVYFDYLGKIDAPTKRGGDGGSVRGVAIRAELESASGGATHLARKLESVVVSTLSKMPRNEQFCVGFNRGKAVGIAALIALFHSFTSPFLAANEVPNLVAFQIINGKANESVFKEQLAPLASLNH
jgi:hypothetical protein